MFKKKLIVFGLIFVVSIVLIILYGSLNPENHMWFPKCPFLWLTGFECPGCGSQRAVHHLLNLNIVDAIRANALLVFAIPYVLLLIFVDVRRRFYLRTEKFPSSGGVSRSDGVVRLHEVSRSDGVVRLHNILHSSKAIWTVFAIIMFWWVFRNF
jgi:hypothetical protein